MNNDIDIIEELGRNFLAYAIDVDQNKAFPSVQDGMLPGARAALWEMYSQKYTSNKPYVKSAKVAAGVIGKFWPHNADATYGTLVRMAQPFVENNLEIDFQGAAGNAILGQDSYGSSRYTEMRLSKLAEQGMLYGLDKQNVDMIWNYCQDEKWPKLLPAVFPRLLVNGSVGLGVGLAQNWALHNFTETAEMIISYLKTGEINEEFYYPDYPTGGIIVNKNELPQINKTGKGRVVIEAKYESYPKQHKIIFTEFPYQVYLEKLIEIVRDAVNKDKILSVDDIYNSSDKNSLGITVIVNKKYTNEECVEELFSKTPLRSSYTIIQNGVIEQVPELVPLKRAVEVYVSHNLSCIKREHEYDLANTLDRIEILEGLAKALGDIDGLIRLIKNSESAAKAKEKLLGYNFTERQADAILAMKLSRLAHLEVNSVLQELKEKRELADSLRSVIDSECEQKKILCERLRRLAQEFGDPRRTQVIQKEIVKPSNVKKKDEPQDVVFCLDENAYAKVVPLGKFHTNESNVREDKTRTDKLVILYSNRGKAYRLKVNAIKPCLNSEKGIAIGPLLELAPDEKIVDFSVNATCPALIMVTKSGRVKVMEAKHIDGTTQNKRGIPMMKIDEEDEIVYCGCIDDKSFVEIRSSGLESRKAIFQISDITPTGKSSSGRIGIKLKDGEHVSYVRLLEDVDKRRISRLGTRGAKV